MGVPSDFERSRGPRPPTIARPTSSSTRGDRAARHRARSTIRAAHAAHRRAARRRRRREHAAGACARAGAASSTTSSATPSTATTRQPNPPAPHRRRGGARRRRRRGRLGAAGRLLRRRGSGAARRSRRCRPQIDGRSCSGRSTSRWASRQGRRALRDELDRRHPASRSRRSTDPRRLRRSALAMRGPCRERRP